MPGEVARSWGKVLGQVAAAAILLGVFGTVAIVESGDARRAAPSILLTLLAFLVIIAVITIRRTPGLTLVPTRRRAAADERGRTETRHRSRRRGAHAGSGYRPHDDVPTDLQVINLMITPEFAAAHPAASVTEHDLRRASHLGYDGFLGQLRGYGTVLLLWACLAGPGYLVERLVGSLGSAGTALFAVFAVAEVGIGSALWSMWLGRRAARYSETAYLSMLGLSVVRTPVAVVSSVRVGGGDVRMVGPSVMAGTRGGRTVESSCEITGPVIRGASATITTTISGPAASLHRKGGPHGWTGSPPEPRLDAFLQRFGTGLGEVEVTAGREGVRVRRSIGTWTRTTRVRSLHELDRIATGASTESAQYQALRDIYLGEQVYALTS
jgi:hypothetical protein